MNFIIQLIISTLAVLITAYLLPGVTIENNSFLVALTVATVLAFLNAVIKPLMILFTIPITIFTLGFFLIIINGIIITITDNLVDGFNVDGFGWALLFSLILSIVTSILVNVQYINKQQE